MRQSVRYLATLLFVVLVAVACTGSDSESTTTSGGEGTNSTFGQPDTSAVSVNDALGGTQAVQDFAIYTGMWESSDVVPSEVYGSVVDLARTDSVDVGAIAGGFDLASVTTLSGRIVDSSGLPVPSVTTTYGLLSVPVELLDATKSELVHAVDPDGSSGVVEWIGSSTAPAQLLLEVVTADYSESRTHAGPGDRLVMEFTDGDSLLPRHGLSVAYLFGQTLPGDPSEEEGLGPLELFRQRWNRGLVRMLQPAGAATVSPYVDRFVEAQGAEAAASIGSHGLEGGRAVAPWGIHRQSRLVFESPPEPRLVAGPTFMAASDDTSTSQPDAVPEEDWSREYKEALLYDRVNRDFERNSERLSEMLENMPVVPLDMFTPDVRTRYAFRYPPGADDDSAVIVEFDQSMAAPDRDSDRYRDCVADHPEGSADNFFCHYRPEAFLGVLPIDAWIAKEAMIRATRRCGDLAAELNRRNGAATAVGELLSSAPLSSAATATDSAATSTGDEPASSSSTTTPDRPDDPLAPQPSPVSCTPELPSGPPKLPTGATWGDIHLGTMDGKRYSNQAAGEFLLFENDATTIQVRTEPRAGDVVSIATAFAFTMGDEVVSLHAGGRTMINGEPAQLQRGISVAVGGGELLWWSGGWVAVWPDGTILRVNQSSVLMFSSVTPSEGVATGMLGNNDGDPENDFFTRDGELLDTNADEDFDSFYSTYVDSWRITADESLFYYSTAHSTATFNIEGVPVEQVTADDLPADLSTEAEQICTQVGVTSPEVLESCILDVGITGDASFAYEAYLAQEAISGAPEEDVAEEAPSVSGEGDSVLTVGDLTIGFGADPPIQDSSGPRPSWTCQSAEGVYTAISRFQESPNIRYELDLQYVGSDNLRGLPERFRLIVLRNSEPYAWVLTNAEQFADSVEFVEVQGDGLTASGEMFLNEPLEPGLQPISPLPAGAALDSFQLSVSCGG